MRRYRRKTRMDKGIDSLSYVNQNHDHNNIDYDDGIEIDIFEDDYDDGFEDIFEDLNFEVEDYDHINNLFTNKIGEF